MKRLLVIDGNSIINRAFYGIRPLSNALGEPTNAIYGAVNMIRRQLVSLSPDYAAVAFDLHHPTFRHEMYPAYKAGRRPTPPDLLAQFDGCKECLSAMGLHVLTKEGYEADDIQGTLARMASEEGVEAYVFSGDRDLLQLIGPRVTVLLAGNSETVPYDADAFRARFGIEVGQYLDLKALMGDSSDNIPGVPGIGEKTAVKLLGEYGSLEGILSHADDPALTPSQRKKLSEGAESGRLSRRLAEIDTEVPLGITLDAVAYGGVDNDRLFRLFHRFEFSALIRQFGLSAPSAPSGNEADEISECVLPTPVEASAAEILADPPHRFAIALDGEAVLLSDGLSCRLCREGLSALAPLFREDAEIVCYDAKSFLHAFYGAGLKNPPILRDLLLYSYLLRAGDGLPLSPEELIRSYLGTVVSGDSPTVPLWLALEERLLCEIEAIGARELLFTVELPLVDVLTRMERVGFLVDLAGLRTLGDYLGERAEEIEARIYSLAGRPFSILSPKQLGEVLFGDLGLPGGKKTKSGYSTAAEVLEGLRDQHPIVPLVLEYRQLTKLRSTYAVGLSAAADGEGRIHTEFRQALTATGRLSSSEPNLQNIPVRTELGRLFRRLFIAKEGFSLVDADYSQIELRLLAHVSDDAAMLEAFSSGVDIHTMTAASVFRLPYEMVTPDLRAAAKAVNFGIMYGIGAHSLSIDLGITHGEAKQYIEDYKASYVGIAEYLDRVVEEATEQGYTVTPFGRRRRIPELAATNKMTQAFGRRIAMNAPIQGASADVMKLAMIAVDRALAREVPEARLVMQVHDELIVEAPTADAPRVAEILRREMEGVATLSLPLSVEAAIGKTWDEAK